MYMVIGGTFGSMLMALLIYSQIRSRRPEMISVPSTRPQISFRKLIIIVLSCFLLGWFVMGKSAENSKPRNSRPYVHTHEGETPRFFIADTGTRITFISRESLFLAGRIDHVTVFNRSRVSVLLSRVPSSVLRIPNFHYALVITHVWTILFIPMCIGFAFRWIFFFLLRSKNRRSQQQVGNWRIKGFRLIFVGRGRALIGRKRLEASENSIPADIRVASRPCFLNCAKRCSEQKRSIAFAGRRW